jgi:hypothetical protein
MGNETKMVRNIKIFLFYKYTEQKLRTIGETFGIGDSEFLKFAKDLEIKFLKIDSKRKKIGNFKKQ